ncbi:DNA polymerase subunit gamma-2, mitochondrial [Diabrotica virgifera virgifera]|uniref:DNA polymerase subunit gamma-2, mitochondrial n=1 Tax=Diabrotica virgifera virgifera TaxID=50390 RepID=A0A6P7G695_DIAVI|nr:DNA polymerase subunit gamma-2, mitochondrial [Diabrotica virgifera virgifera]
MLKRTLDLATNGGFLKKTVLPNYNIDQFKIGPLGLLLCQNINTEWLYHTLINKELTVCPNEGDIDNTYNFVKILCSSKLPFGITDVNKQKKSFTTDEIVEYYKNASKGEKVSFENLLRHEEDVFLKFTIFVSPSDSTQMFHQWQKQRRIWFRKFSAAPGRYLLSDIKNVENTIQTVDITAKYSWGTQLLETITLNREDKNFTNQQLEFKERKFVTAHTITSQINLPTIFLNTICDAYQEPVFQDKVRPMFHFHRKLAPFKLSFAMTGSSQAITKELEDLALYLCKQLRENHVSTLYLPSSSRNTLEAQYKQYDQLGIPYTVVLNERTLNDGVANLRSRDTTLKEQVHITELVTYVEQLFRNY